MAVECVVIASATAPVKEVIRDGENGVLVDFFDAKGIAQKVENALGGPKVYEAVRAQAREVIEERFDLKRVCLPRQFKLVESVLRGTEESSERRSEVAAIRPSGAESRRTVKSTIGMV
jgi:glycosyltransferase involved in cell wall biosynthesis